MLRAAGEFFFGFQELRTRKSGTDVPMDRETVQSLKRRFDELCGKAQKLSERRNEIAHGIVGLVPQGMTNDRTFYLRPAYNESKKHKELTTPKFSYGSKEITSYSEQFADLASGTYHLNEDVRAMLKARRGASPPRS
jgi:hypothetical protein